MLNPMIVGDQRHGTTATGLSGTSFGHIGHDEQGQDLTGSLADHLIATAEQAPSPQILEMHPLDRQMPAGMKGMAQGDVEGTIGAPSIAVDEARAPLDVPTDSHRPSPEVVRATLSKLGRRPMAELDR
jgi:carbon-monoxide dehydrogenase large subunit